MWEGLLNGIRQMGVFMICAQALIYFKPKGSYEKYLKLLVSAMILVQLLSPVAALLSGKEGQSLEERIGYYSNSFEQGLGEAALLEYQMEQIRQQLLTTQIRAQMEAWDWQPMQQDNQTAGQDSQTAGQDNQTAGQNNQTAEQNSQTVGQDSQTAGQGSRTTGQDNQTAGQNNQTVGQNSREEAGEIRIQIAPVTIGVPQDGQQDMGQREDEHGREDQERDGEMAEEG